MRLGLLVTHPVQYSAHLYRALARAFDFEVFYAHRQDAAGQADAGFGVAFEWDIPLLDGYPHRFLTNRARTPDVGAPFGTDTPEISGILARERFDAFVLTGWYTKSLWQGLVGCWRTGTPVLMRGDSHLQTPRSAARRLAKEAAYRAFIPRLDGCLPVGQRSAAYFRHYGARPDRVFVVPYSVDEERFVSALRRAEAERAALRARFRLSPDARVFVFVGKLLPGKRPLDFVEAVAALARRQRGVEGLVVGDGPMRGAVEAAVTAAGAPVRMAGFLNQSEIPAAYAASDVLVLPSESETWGLVVNEAMAAGCAAVVSDVVGCAPDLIHPGRTGETFPTGDVNVLAGAMERVLTYARTPALQRALDETLRAYSTDAAVEGVRRAVERVGRRRS